MRKERSFAVRWFHHRDPNLGLPKPKPVTELGCDRTARVIYANPTATKLAEHGGFLDDDNRVPIVVATAGGEGSKVDAPVLTRQIAPTILELLGLNGAALDAVRIEGTAQLPLGELARNRRARGMAESDRYALVT